MRIDALVAKNRNSDLNKMPPKKCSHCKQVKAAIDFPIDTSRPSGLALYCKICGREKNRKQYYRDYVRTTQKLRRGRQSRGLCPICEEPKSATTIYCDRHDRSARQHLSDKKMGRVERGVCIKCGKRPPVNSVIPRCMICYMKDASYKAVMTNRFWPILLLKYQQQDGRCVYTNDIIVLGQNAHLDHIFSRARCPEKLDDPFNFQWLTRTANMMKQEQSHDEFLASVTAIYNHCIATPSSR
jgi:hypothetical protein